LAGRHFSAFGTNIISFPDLQHHVSVLLHFSIHTGHRSAINVFRSNFKTNPNEFRLLTGSSDKTIKVWKSLNLIDFTEYTTCDGHLSPVTALAWLKGNFVSGGSDGEMYYWIHNGHRYNPRLIKNKAHPMAITHIQTIQGTFHRTYVLSGDLEGFIGISIISKGHFTFIEKVTAHHNSISTMHVAKIESNTYVFTASRSETIINIWRLKMGTEDMLTGTFDELRSIDNAHEGGVALVQYISSCSQLVSLGTDSQIKMWRKKEDSSWEVNQSFQLKREALCLRFLNTNDITYLSSRNVIMRQSPTAHTLYALPHPILTSPNQDKQ
jgi:WD40 repeat protein